MPYHHRLLTGFAMLAFLCSAARADEWYVSYDEGVKSIGRKSWQEAINHFNDAIRARPDSKARTKTYGQHFIDYFPYVYRGLAYYETGNSTKALADFEKEERLGEISNPYNDEEAEQILRTHLELLRRSKTVDTKFAEGQKSFSEKQYAKAIELFQSVERNSPNYTSAQTQLKLAQEELRKSNAVAVKPAAPPTEKRDPVAEDLKAGEQFLNQNDLDQAEARFRSVLRASSRNARARQYLARIAVLRRKTAAVAKESAPPGNVEPPGGTTTPAVNQQELLFREGVSLFSSGKLPEATAKFTDLGRVNPSYPELAAYLDSIRQNNEKTKRGITSFFEGDYPVSISNLSDASKKGGDNVTIYAFLACAYASQYYLTGAEDKNLQQSALDALKKVRQLNPAYKLDARYFSPRVIALFNAQ